MNTELNTIKILGASGGKCDGEDLISILLSKNIILDAGNIMNAKNIDLFDIDHIFITHAHLDHIMDIGLLIDTIFSKRTYPLKIYGSKLTLSSIKNHILNWEIWPDFTQIHLINSKMNAIELVEIEIGQSILIDPIEVKSIKNNHTEGSNGYIVTKNKKSICFTSDTFICHEIWDEINKNQQITTIVTEVSFPSDMVELAKSSKHLTPKLLKEELNYLQNKDITIYLNHLKPSFKEVIISELNEMKNILNGGRVLNSNDIIEF